MIQILNWLYVISAVVFLFGCAVFVHEFGHYWVARRLGMKVEAFAIGFGPKIWGWTKDGIEYSVRWIPAGGFVKLPQMVTSEALEGKADSGEKIPPAAPLAKILVAFAGPLMNVIFAFVVAGIIYLVGLPVPVNPPIIGYVEPGSAEAKLGIVEGDKIVEVDGKQIKGWDDVQTATILARTNVLPVVVEHEGVRKTHHLTATVSDAIGLKVLNLDPRDHPVIKSVKAGMAAEAAGLKEGDEIISFGKVPLVSREQFIKLIQERAGQPTELAFKRENEKRSITITPRENPTTKKGFIGAEIGGSAKVVYLVQRPGPTPWAQVSDVFDKTVSTFSALIHSKQTGVGAKDLSGPVGIFALLASQVNADYRLALSFFVLLSINLAMINLLPIPVLDGGHILMAVIEKIRRRPLPQKFVEYVTTGFAVLLISFMLYVTYFDFMRFRLFKALFNRETQIEQQEAPPQPAPIPSQQ